MVKNITKERLLFHIKEYPRAQIADIFKFLHQSSFGCEHMVKDEQSALEYIIEEKKKTSTKEQKVECLDGDFCRVHLSCLDTALKAKTLARLFYLSSQCDTDGRAALEEKLMCCRELVLTQELPFSLGEFDRMLNEWREAGFAARHHSDTFRAEYAPSYRVISKKYVTFLPLFERIDGLTSENAIVAIEGGSASGKSTLSEILSDVYDCTVFHMDDFFLRPEQRTPERFAEVGGNIDHERFLCEVLTPLREGKTVNYRRFDCCEMKIQDGVDIQPKSLNIVEGAYSMHPSLYGLYDLSVFLDVDAELQRTRIEKRNSPDMAKRFFDTWIPLEQKYFSATNVKERCDITIKIK